MIAELLIKAAKTEVFLGLKVIALSVKFMDF